MKNIENIIWTAGILEGEGSFRTKTDGHMPIVSCQMTDQDVIQKIQSIWGGNVYYERPRKDGYKESWKWQVSGDSAEILMNNIKPFMFSRRTQKINEVLGRWNEQKQKNKAIEDNGMLAAQEYLLGSLSLRQVAKKYKISYETVRRYVNKTK